MTSTPQQTNFTIVGTLCTLLAMASVEVNAHSRSSLTQQAESCFGTWGGGYSEYVQCGYGRAEVQFKNTFARDGATDGHCAYTRRYIASKDRYVEVKSCGGSKHLHSRGATGYNGFAACITGHWFCFWR